MEAVVATDVEAVMAVVLPVVIAEKGARWVRAAMALVAPLATAAKAGGVVAVKVGAGAVAAPMAAEAMVVEAMAAPPENLWVVPRMGMGEVRLCMRSHRTSRGGQSLLPLSVCTPLRRTTHHQLGQHHCS